MYSFLRASVRAALYLYCGRIRVLRSASTPHNGPVLFASNHPNSFLDALIIATNTEQRMHFLARGDVFRNPFAKRILEGMNMIPIYRMQEGRNDLQRTGSSFDRSQDVLASGDALLIFSEGLSENCNGSRPLGKGTGRIAFRAWKEQDTTSLIVVPVWITYDTFHEPYFDVCIGTGGPIHIGDLPIISEPQFLRAFNELLQERLMKTGEALDEFYGTARKRDAGTIKYVRQLLLSAPALVGFILHAPWYFTLRAVTTKKTKGTVFFDSVLFGLLFLTYPIWLGMLVLIGAASGLKYWALAAFVIAPSAALCLKLFRTR